MTLVLTLRHSIEMRFTLKRLTGNYFGRAISDVGYDLKSLSGRIFLKFCILSSDDEDFSTIKLMIKPQLFFFCVSGRNVTIPGEVIVLNSIVLPHKDLGQSYKNEIIL